MNGSNKLQLVQTVALRVALGNQDSGNQNDNPRFCIVIRK